jgi:hypothetical protein
MHFQRIQCCSLFGKSEAGVEGFCRSDLKLHSVRQLFHPGLQQQERERTWRPLTHSRDLCCLVIA